MTDAPLTPEMRETLEVGGKVIDLMGALKASLAKWRPSESLRADATDEQIEEREEHLCAHHGPGPHNRKDGTGCFACANVARELAFAVSAEKQERIDALARENLQAFNRIDALCDDLVASRRELSEKDAEIARLRRDAERLDALEAREYQIECMGTSVPYFNVWAKNGELFTTAETREKFTLRRAIDSAREAK